MAIHVLRWFYAQELNARHTSMAMHYAMKAAELGNPMGLFLVGKYYENGIAVPVDKVKALEWYGKCVKEDVCGMDFGYRKKARARIEALSKPK